MNLLLVDMHTNLATSNKNRKGQNLSKPAVPHNPDLHNRSTTAILLKINTSHRSQKPRTTSIPLCETTETTSVKIHPPQGRLVPTPNLPQPAAKETRPVDQKYAQVKKPHPTGHPGVTSTRKQKFDEYALSRCRDDENTRAMANKAIEFAKVKDETLPRQSTTYDTNY